MQITGSYTLLPLNRQYDVGNKGGFYGLSLWPGFHHKLQGPYLNEL